MTLMEDYYIRSGDGCIIFLGDDGREHILLPGATPAVGHKLVVHPATGEILTHGHEYIQVGDTVIVVPLDDGDQAALKPAISQETGCKPIMKWVYETTNQEWVDSNGNPIYRSYDIHLSEPFYRQDHDLNMNAYFMKYDNDKPYGFLNNQFPYGGVTIGFGYSGGHPTLGSGYHGPCPDVAWFWDLDRSPYATISGGPQWDLGDESGINKIENDNPHYCYMDALNENVCNLQTPFRSTLPGDTPIEYVHIQIRTYGGAYFAGCCGTRSFLQGVDFCRQVPSECETRCYGGRNKYPPITGYNLMDHPEDWEEYIEEWP